MFKKSERFDILEKVVVNGDSNDLWNISSEHDKLLAGRVRGFDLQGMGPTEASLYQIKRERKRRIRKKYYHQAAFSPPLLQRIENYQL